MSRAVAAVLLLAATGGVHAATPRRHVDPDAIRETRRVPGERFASPRAISHYLEARREQRAGNPEKAAEHLRLAVAYDETSPELRVALAEALAVVGQIESAQVEARHALELSGEGRTASEAQVLLGRIAAARRQKEEAVLALRSAIRLEIALAEGGDRADPEPWRLLAAVYLEAGEEEAAVRTLEDLAEHAPGDASGFRELGRAYLERHDPGRAEALLRRAARIDAGDVETHRLLAEAHEELRREGEARDDLLAILRADPDDAPTLLALGRIAVHAGEVEQAREWFHRHVRASTDPTDAHVRVVFQWLEGDLGEEALAAARAGIEDVGPDPRLRFAEGIALQELRRWPESAEALAAVGPESGELFVSARVALADALSRAGRHAEAERALEAPLARSPDEVRLVTMRAAVLDRAGRARDAVALLRHAIEGREKRRQLAELSDLYASLAESLIRTGRAADAVATLRGALADRPRDEVLLYALGAAYERVGQIDAAIAQMRALLALDPDHAEALNFVGYTLAEQGTRLEEAERLIRRALELRPRSGHVLDSLGWVLFRRGDFRRAVEVLEQADRLAGPDATILEHLGDAYQAAARPAEAAQAYRKALTSVGDEPAAEQGRKAALEKKLRDVARP